MMDQSMVTLGWVILMWKFILLKLSPCLWVKSGGNWQFIDERDGEKAFLGNQNNKCLHILSFSSTRLSALKIVSLILSKDRKINAYGKEPTANAGDVRDTVWSLGWKDPLEEGMATHSDVLAGGIPWTEEAGRLLSIASHRVRDDWSDLAQRSWLTEQFSGIVTAGGEIPCGIPLSPSICSLLYWWIIPKLFSPQGRYCVSSDYAQKMDPKQIP